MRLGLTFALIFGVSWPAASLAHHERDDLRRSILIELKSVSSQIKFARHRLEALLSTKGRLSEERIGAAQSAFYQSRPERALVLLQDLLSRPDFKQHPARPEALFWYGESLLALNFSRAASEAFAEAVASPRQTSSAFKHRFERMLDVDRGVVEPRVIQEAWGRYQEMVSPKSGAFSRVRYKVGRGLYRCGEDAQAAAVFGAVVPADPEFVRSSYFLGVIHLRRGEIVDAEKRFEGALAAWQAETPKAVVSTQTVDVDGAARELAISEVKDDEAERAHLSLGYALHLALGRLAAHQEKLDQALKHYRQVPPGSADYAAAQREMVYVLQLSAEYAWAARALASTLPERLGSSPEFMKALEYSRLLAQEERYADAEEMFAKIASQVSQAESKLMEMVENPDSEAEVARWLFPELSARWEGVARSPAELGDEVAQTRALLTELERVASSSNALPVVAQGQRVQTRVRGRLAELRRNLKELRELPKVDLAETDRMTDSVNRLAARLARFERRLSQYQRAYAGRLRTILRAEVPEVVALEQRLRQHAALVDAHRRELRGALSAHVASHDTAAVLGQVNIVFWQKEAISQKIERLLFEKRRASEPVETFPVEAADPIGPAEVSWGQATPKTKRARGDGTPR